MKDNKILAAILLTSTLTCAHMSSAIAGPNDFFGGPGTTSSPSAAAGAEAAQNALVDSPQPGDFTDDEKRMQKKYKEKIRHAKSLIEKGELMMKKGEGKDDKAFKKGKVFKQIGERELAELQANNPFPDKDKKEPTGKDATPDKQDEATKTEL